MLADRRDSDSLGRRLQCVPVPTALFSAHTRYAVFTFHDTTDILSGYLDAWQKEDVELDGVYSGFLGSPDQVAIIQRLYREYPNALRLVDPVMGDAGEMYPRTHRSCARQWARWPMVPTC